MASLAEVITHALAPGVALTSAVIYNSIQQGRIIHITMLVRDLNKEARELRDKDAQKYRPRIESIRRQVTVLMRRARVVRWSIMSLFAGFACFMLTILGSLLSGVFYLQQLAYPSLGAFGTGFVCIGLAATFSAIEVFLGNTTLTDDVASSFEPEDDADSRPVPGTRALHR